MIDAMAIAAKALGYPGAAWIISHDRLNPCQVSRMFLSGESKDRGEVAPLSCWRGASAASMTASAARSP